MSLILMCGNLLYEILLRIVITRYVKHYLKSCVVTCFLIPQLIAQCKSAYTPLKHNFDYELKVNITLVIFSTIT